MSELDLGATPTATPAAAAPAGGLVLTPPEPVQVVQPEQAPSAVPLEAGKELELRQKASAFVTDLTTIDT
ncbi:MAG TPA: toxic anion resistance protein, partial [Cellulomonas sp.]|nr:toxic anion resistance protein [Cellulomonas sp.]